MDHVAQGKTKRGDEGLLNGLGKNVFEGVARSIINDDRTTAGGTTTCSIIQNNDISIIAATTLGTPYRLNLLQNRTGILWVIWMWPLGRDHLRHGLALLSTGAILGASTVLGTIVGKGGGDPWGGCLFGFVRDLDLLFRDAPDGLIRERFLAVNGMD